ncbi:hypothetical protein BABINDRAFT_162947 [Babjeviella inositovora NRRL Y-12698]|uniref:carnosine N-methyltransferase n=1 Tax=Babjeviella inositovora NRRL Y-12698 TaxID=984486 RepID=A0A1E3QKS1_9ASCO|nr:uncharacterized protein BABINDRAFT_162947 [Babjeviella inositovora NRRL Y-12698]ODQ78299.1 hypothetical protein BABINDRAFT_162947 [Babjeviella inositovora NRRL Y-12698]
MNQEFTQNLATAVAADWQVATPPDEWAGCTDSDFDKVRSVLLQFTREWSEECITERECSFGRITEYLIGAFPSVPDRQQVKVLVPGAGLGRLVVDLVKEGFTTQGNEFSYHMLLASNFILNHTYVAHHYSIFPFLHKFSHTAKRNSQLRPVTVPDFRVGDVSELNRTYPDIPVGDLMSMTAGSFVDLYGPPGLALSETYSADATAASFRTENAASWDVVATCFFLDTAANVIDYVRSIHYCLRAGGTWVNFGPLLWHHEDDEEDTDKGLELSCEDLLELVVSMGFEFIKHENGIETTYGCDSRSLGKWVYECEFWVCKKM